MDEARTVLRNESLAGQHLRNTSLADAVLEDCDLSGADFSDADLTRCRLLRCCCDHTVFTDATFDHTELSACSLRGASLFHTSLRRTRFVDTALDNVVLERATLDGVIFSGTSWAGVNLHRATLLNMEAVPHCVTADLSMGLWINCALAGMQFTAVNAVLLVLENCIAPGLVCTDSDMTQFTAMNTDLSGAGFTRCVLQRAGFMGSNLSGSECRTVDMEGGQLASARLTLARWPGVCLDKATLTAADLEGADLSGASLRMADMSHARVRHARFDRADLTLANLHAVDMGQAVTTGATLTGARPTDPRLLAAENFRPLS